MIYVINSIYYVLHSTKYQQSCKVGQNVIGLENSGFHSFCVDKFKYSSRHDTDPFQHQAILKCFR
jgi:hypothetical protein